MKTPLHIVISKLKRMTLTAQCEELMRLVAAEKPHSGRRAELQAILYHTRQREIRHNNRMMAKAKVQAA